MCRCRSRRFTPWASSGRPSALQFHTHVREDALQLFGFATALEQSLFERLIATSGIGPKVALAILSGIEPEGLVRAIRGADLGRLTSIPGVGRKTAERLILELKDRLRRSPRPRSRARPPSPTISARTCSRRSAIWAINARRPDGRLTASCRKPTPATSRKSSAPFLKDLAR